MPKANAEKCKSYRMKNIEICETRKRENEV